ncbi:hypothetical protein L210DRAFT_3562027 [Boletus edulis BED1]|uniref:Uncharacterized protein n=1 Tax=Boletus edulis BED1 TaxID=1328754 RepID=A0AAD4BHQ1_BOLED|nr:hypothetical protein L210DRAFT_3562027 [Boletus edulis BED1]
MLIEVPLTDIVHRLGPIACPPTQPTPVTSPIASHSAFARRLSLLQTVPLADIVNCPVASHSSVPLLVPPTQPTAITSPVASHSASVHRSSLLQTAIILAMPRHRHGRKVAGS